MNPSNIALLTLAAAKTQINVRESGGPNRGPQVDKYLAAAGLDAHRGNYPWCLAFLVWCAKQANAGACPFKPTASTTQLREWSRLAGTLKTAPLVGDIGLIRFTKTSGHAFIVAGVSGSVIQTIEGNTNNDGSRDGYGVFARTRILKPLNATASGSIRFVRY